MPVWLALMPAISQLLDRIIPDPQARENAKLALTQAENAQALQEMQLSLQADTSQMQVDTSEAQNKNLFVAGWRPFYRLGMRLCFCLSFYRPAITGLCHPQCRGQRGNCTRFRHAGIDHRADGHAGAGRA